MITYTKILVPLPHYFRWSDPAENPFPLDGTGSISIRRLFNLFKTCFTIKTPFQKTLSFETLSQHEQKVLL